jgi:hypothetical protein
MEQNHPAFLVDIEKHPRDSVLHQARPHLVDAVAQWSANGHPKRPAKFHGLDVLADPLPILRRQPFQPTPNRLSSCPRPKEDCWNPLVLFFECLGLRTLTRGGLWLFWH